MNDPHYRAFASGLAKQVLEDNIDKTAAKGVLDYIEDKQRQLMLVGDRLNHVLAGLAGSVVSCISLKEEGYLIQTNHPNKVKADIRAVAGDLIDRWFIDVEVRPFELGPPMDK